MSRVIEFEYNGKPYEAYCPAAAIFDIYDRCGEVGDIAELTGFDKQTREGWDECCRLLAELCRWGELRRRHLGEDPRDMLTAAELQLAPPVDVPALRLVVIRAISAGFRREIPDEERERDLVLEELDREQKKTKPAARFSHSIWPRARRSSG